MKNVLALLGLMLALPKESTLPANSRRAEVLARRQSFAGDETAELNPISSIAVGFILMVVAFVIALTVLPLIADSTAAAQASPNVTGSNDTLLGLIPTLLIVVLVVGAIAFLVHGFRGLKENLERFSYPSFPLSPSVLSVQSVKLLRKSF